MSNAYLTYVTEDSTLDYGWDTYLMDASSNNITMTLQQSYGDGLLFTFSRVDDNSSNTVTIVANSGSLINGGSSVTLNPHENITITSWDNNWYTIHGKWQ